MLVLCGLGWFANYWWRTGRWIETTDDAYVGGNTTPLSPQAAGQIVRVLIEDNQRVAAGQLLIQIDDRLYRAALDHAEAAVQQQQATLRNLHTRLQLQLSLIQSAKATLTAKIAAAAFAGQEAQRYKALAVSSAGTEQNAQRTTAADEQARAGVDGSRADLDAAKQQIDVLKTQVSQAEAALASAEADRQTAKLNIGYTQIRSPIDGFVGNRVAQVGSYVSTGAYLLTVVPANQLWIDANFKEDQLEHMKVGQPATIVLDVAPGRTLHGHVISLSPATGAVFSVIPPENATGNFTKIVQRVPVRIVLDDPSQMALLRPGLSTTIGVDTRAK
ncbi:MAG TPA: HlyD family secretion protein [Methylovirgula sp.]|nr:HlyD family secretion protein [Methylovirgula sp.]